MKNKILTLILVLIVAMLLTGCWDRVEIDRRVFVSTIGIDVGDDVESKAGLNKDFDINQYKDLNIVKISYAFPDLRKMDTGTGTAEGVSLTVQGYSPTDAYFKATGISSRSLNFGHTKLLIISNEIFNYPELEKEVMDYIEREPNLNRSIIIAVVEGKTEDYINAKLIMEDRLDSYITNLLGNGSTKSSLAPLTLTKYIDMVRSKAVSMLPVFKLENETEIALSSVAVIEDNEIKAYLSMGEMENIQILRSYIGTSRKAVMSEGHPVDYYIETVNTKLDINYIDDKLYLNYHVFTEGDITGYYTGAKEIQSEDIKEFEEQLNNTMEEELLEVANKTKNVMKLDVLAIEDKLKKYHPIIWRKIEGDWENKFENAEISVDVKNQIRTVGIVN